jgi:hypothetical protein
MKRSSRRRGEVLAADHLQPGIDRFALQREHSEDALVDAAEGFAANEALQRLDSEGELPKREAPLGREPARP